MRRPSSIAIILLLFVLQVFTSFCYATKMPAQKRAKISKQAVGYCCVEGKLAQASQKSCRALKGSYFNDQATGKKRCRKMPTLKPTGTMAVPALKTAPDKSPVPSLTQPRLRGYCCERGSVDKLFKDECQKRKGSFSTVRAIAERTCGEIIGYCCDEGEVSRIKNKKCSRKGGRFFEEQREANKICGAVRGYCCADGETRAAAKRECDRLRGMFSSKQTQAASLCASEKGYCCLGGKVISGIRRVCEQRGGSFSVNRWEADKSCREDYRASLRSGESERVGIKNPDSEGKGAKVIPPRTGVKQNQAAAGIKAVEEIQVLGNKVTPEYPEGPPEATPMRQERGISINIPAGSERFYQGETIHIVAQVLGEDYSPGMINFTVMNEASIIAGTASVASAPLVSVNLTLRDDAPLGNYYVTASLAPDKYGSSDIFSIHRNTGRIDILSPDRSSTVYPGTNLDIAYKVNARVEPGPIVFDLYQSGTVVQSETVDYNPGPPIRAERDSVRHFRWPLAGDFPVGEGYTFLARHSRANGFSEPFNVIAHPGFGDGDGTTVSHDLALVEVSIKRFSSALTAVVQNNGDAFEADVEFDVNLIMFGGLRTFQRHLSMGAGESQEVVLSRFDDTTFTSYRDQCGLPLSVELRVPDWQRGIPDEVAHNNQIEKTLYLPYGGIQITSSRLVMRRRGYGGGGTVENGGRLDWSRDFGIERRDSGETSNLVTSLTIKNCDARIAPYDETIITITARGNWSCGDGTLGTCNHEERIWGPVHSHFELDPGDERSFDQTLPNLRHVNLIVNIRASSSSSSRWDDFQFFLALPE